MPGTCVRLLFQLLYRLALRRSEAASLRWEDIDFHQGQMHIIQKGGTQKTLPIPKDVVHTLKAYQERLKHEDKESAFVFCALQQSPFDQQAQRPLSTTTLYQIITKNASRIIPEKHITPHSLRKTFIEIAMAQNINLTALMNATGHESTQMIRYYDTQDQTTHNAILMVR